MLTDTAKKAVFIDKDGTLIENVPYNVDPEKVRLLPGALAGLQALHATGFHVIVISNQSGVARGLFALEALLPVELRVRQLLASAHVPLTGFYCCPHLPEGTVPLYARVCLCRKPAPGMLLRAAREHNIDLTRSWMVGDILDDIEAGRRAHCRTVLIENGGETEWRWTPERAPHLRAANLAESAWAILREAGSRSVETGT